MYNVFSEHFRRRLSDTTKTKSEFKNELDENKVQFVRTSDKYFDLCKFQRFVLYLQRVF